MKILNLIFHNFVLIFEFKYNFKIMQLRLQPRSSKKSVTIKFVIKIFLFVSIFFLAIFLLDRVEMPVPSEQIKQEISNDKLITLK
tara:strand:+ start:567 stop:821 length:255 start_codon:yes stop_codon:yes gene_type:complete